MLHLIFQTVTDSSILHRIDSGDDVVFFENALFRLNQASILSDELQRMLKNNVNLYVLSDELETRGINTDELVLGIEAIDYKFFVRLTEKNQVVSSWN
ncbi:MAG: sulfurtransferase complex subunit TusB [Methylococcales bacterium]|nr:sulfurtransferase complex subunit TusB [Methylococcales bacterium]